MWIVQGLAYLALIVIYWAPGEADENQVELRGLMMFMLIAVAALLVWLQVSGNRISDVATTFWSIMTGTAQKA